MKFNEEITAITDNLINHASKSDLGKKVPREHPAVKEHVHQRKKTANYAVTSVERNLKELKEFAERKQE